MLTDLEGGIYSSVYYFYYYYLSGIDWRDEGEDSNAGRWSFNNEIKQRTKITEGEKQTGRELCTLNIHTRSKTTDQGGSGGRTVGQARGVEEGLEQ